MNHSDRSNNTAATTAPTPLIDQLDHLGNPYRYIDELLSRQPQLDDSLIRNDMLQTLSFLTAYNGNQATFNSYRREVEKLLQWAWFVRQVKLSQLRRQDLESYLEFCQSPPAAWCGHSQVARFRNIDGQRQENPAWRPFVIKNKTSSRATTELSQKSLQAIFSILSTFFTYLLQEGYVDINPVSLIKQKSKFLQRRAYQEPVRRISNLQWDFVIEQVERMANENPNEHERTLFIMQCLLGMYLRISELVSDQRSSPVMGDFHTDEDGNWWLRVLGKGNKLRVVTVSDDMLSALRRYRRFLGLNELPYVGEQTPLIAKVRGRGPVTSTRQIRYLVQQCFDLSYQKMCADGLMEEARELQVATVHWLRHTGISEDVKIRPKEHVREDAGHASMSTTDRYIDTELRERHASAKYKRLKPQ